MTNTNTLTPQSIRSKLTKCGAQATTIGSYEDIGGNKVYMFRVGIDADAATLLLEAHGNPNNRNILKSNVTKLVHDMDNGRWEDNGDPLVLDQNLMFKNGHHRLNALSQSEAKVTFNVLVGISSDLYDVGKPRTVKDQMKMSGIDADITKKVPSIMVAWYLSQGRSEKRVRFTGSFSNAEIIEGTEHLHETVGTLHEEVTGAENRHLARPQVIGSLVWASQQVGADKAKEFLIAMREMEGLTKGSPILWLAKRLGGAASTMTGTQRENLALDVLYAFKAHCDGDTDVTKQPSQKRRLEAYDYFATADGALAIKTEEVETEETEVEVEAETEAETEVETEKGGVTLGDIVTDTEEVEAA